MMDEWKGTKDRKMHYDFNCNEDSVHLTDPGGSWWPPAKPTWTPIIVLLSIFSFLNCSTTYYF